MAALPSAREERHPLRLAWVSNAPAPYQLELLSALRRRPGLEVLPAFLEPSAPGRRWAVPAEAAALVAPSVGSRRGELAWHPGLASRLLAFRPDVALLGGYSYLTLQALMLRLRLAGVPFVGWCESPRLEQGAPWRRGARRALIAPLRLGAGMLAVGGRAAATWRALLGPAVPIASFPYACDVERYLHLPRPRPATPFRFLFSGQLVERKGVDLLLAAFAEVAVREPGVELHLAGDGPLRIGLEAAVPAALRPRVRFLGFQPWAALPAFYASGDALVVPSRHDGWGLVVAEGLAAGLPVVATTGVGAGLELLAGGEAGRLCPPDDAAALARAMLEVRERHAVLGAAARRIGRGLGVDAAAARLGGLLGAVARGEAGPATGWGAA